MPYHNQWATNALTDDKLAVFVLNVGHGDSIVIRFPILDNRVLCAVVDCYNSQKVRHTLTKLGATELPFVCATHPHSDHMQGFKALGEQHRVPFWCTGLAPMSCPGFRYEDPELNADVWTLFLQETAKRGVLIRRGGLLFVTYSHDDPAVEQTLAAVDEALGIVQQAVSKGKVKEYLRTQTVQESFRRF